MSGITHPALLVAAAAKDPQILHTFPLTEITETLSRWNQPIPHELRIPLSGTQAARTIRRMPAEQAAIAARYADTDEETFRALHADRRVSVQRALAVNPSVPPALRRAWLTEHADLKRPLDRNDKTAVALVAGTLAEGWPANGLDAAGFGTLLEGCSTWTWQHILSEMPPAASWSFLRSSDLTADTRLTLLLSAAGAMPEESRPTAEELSDLIEHALHADQEGQNFLHAGDTLPPWLLRALLNILPELPEPLLASAYTTAALLVRRNPGAQHQNLRQRASVHGRILARILHARSEGRQVPLPGRIHPAHLTAALTEGCGTSVRVDEALLDALIAGMPMHGIPVERLGGPAVDSAALDLAGLDRVVWQQRLDHGEDEDSPGRSRRFAYAANIAILLAGPGRAAELPEPLLRLCGRRSTDGQALALLCELQLPGSDDLRRRLSGPTDLGMPTICGLIALGHLSLQESIGALEADALAYAQRGFRPVDGVTPLSDEWNSLDIMEEVEGTAGLVESFRQTPATDRIALLGALSRRTGRDDSPLWAAAATGLAPLLEEALEQPHDTLNEQANHMHARWAVGPQALSAAAFVLLEAGRPLPDLLTVDGPAAERSVAGLDGAAGKHLLLRYAGPTGPGDRGAGPTDEPLRELARMLRPRDLLEHPYAARQGGHILGNLLGHQPHHWRMFSAMAATWKGSVPLLAAAVHHLSDQTDHTDQME